MLKLNAKDPMQDPRVPLLRERLDSPGDAADLTYDAKLAEAVKKFQKAPSCRRPAISTRGPSRSSTARRATSQIDMVIANMERWRWYPRDLGKRQRRSSTIPDFTLKVMHDGSQSGQRGS